MKTHGVFKQKWLALLLVMPQIAVTIVFFLWPSFEALKQSLMQGDAFGIHQRFAGLMNFKYLFQDPTYIKSLIITLIYSLLVTGVTLSLGLFIAYLVMRLKRGGQWYKTLFIIPYAIAPAVAGILWRFLFNPSVGVIAHPLQMLGLAWNYLLNPLQAFFLIVFAASWQQFSYNFIFYLAALYAIPHTLIEAAELDGASAWQRFRSIIFPLLAPTSIFLFVMNLIYAFFDTFGVIQVITRGGPANATNTLMYKVYQDGFVGLDLGGSAAQSVILMLIVIGLTMVQFRYLDKKVHYS